MDDKDKYFYPSKIKDTSCSQRKKLIINSDSTPKLVSKEEYKNKYQLPIKDYQKEQEEKEKRLKEISERYSQNIHFQTFDYRHPKTIQNQLIIKQKERRRFNEVRKLNENEYDALKNYSMNVQFLKQYNQMQNTINE